MNSHSPFISETLFRPIKKCNPKIFVLLVLFFSINKFSLSQVNLQTGSATFSLPMFNWHDHKSNLTTMVGLSYNSGSGLKVNDVASEVGQGWSLIAGGVITRLQVGEPDDQVKYANGQVNAADPTENDIYKYPNGYLYANRKAYEGCPSALTKYPLYGAKNLLYKQYNSVTEDKQLDYFAFQFNGKSGMFVLNAAANNPADPAHEDIGLPLGDTKIKIKFQRASSPSPGTRNTITSFTIQDVDGLLYTFSRLGSTKLLNTKYCDRSGNYRQEQPKFKEGKVYYQNDYDDNVPQPYVVSSWYLTSITDSLTQPLRSVTFNYRTTDEDINAYAGADLSYNQSRDYSTVSFKRSISKKPRLESITYPDGHTVSFEYKKSRVDFNGSSALTAVNITYYNGIVSRTLSKYLINTTYFILNRYGTPVSDYQKSVARLCLKSVQKIGPDLKEDSPPYIFDYYTGSDASGDFVPPPFYYKKDVWGYYNADKSVNTHGGQLTKTSVVDLTKDEIVGLCFLREIAGNNNNYTTDFFNVKPDYAKNGLLKQIIYPTGGALTYDYAQNAVLLNSQNQQIGGVHVFQTGSTDGGSSNGCGNPIITTYNYINSTGGSSLWGFEMPANYSILYSFYSPYDKYYKFPVFGGCGIFGCCKYKFLFPGILSVQQATNLSDLMKLVEAISPVLGVIGSVSSVLNAIKVFTTSSGALAIVALVIDIITGLYTIYASCIRNQARTLDARTYSDYDLNSANPLPVQFKRVEVTESPGTNGKTVYQFTQR